MTFFKKPKKLKQADESRNNEETLEKRATAIEKSDQTNQISIDDLVLKVKEPFSATEDLITQWIELPADKSRVALMFIDSIIDKETVQNRVLNPFFELSDELKMGSFYEVAPIDLKKQSDFSKASELLLQSNTLIFTEDTSCFYSALTPAKTDRNIKEPDNEAVIRGSHDGFVESITMNLSLIRKRIKSPKLTITFYKVGSESQTQIAMIYVKDIANPDHIKELEKRIKSIEAEFVMSPGNVEESIEDRPFSFFPQMLSTERPDRVTANLMEGRIALIYDTSPTAHIIPVNFFTFYQSPDDYNKRWILGSFFRSIRLFSFFIALGLPAVYIALVSFHFEVIPFGLILLVKSSLETIPYSPLIEAMLMELTIELIREASIRLPTRIGSTIAIVGGLVIGESIVRAGLVSNLMIIVVATTAIAAYIVPSNEMSMAVRLLRFPFMLAAATFGFMGIVFGFMLLIFHLCRLYTFGSPYFAPIAPLRLENLRDTFVRVPFWKMNQLPKDSSPVKLTKEYKTRKWDENE